jgi:hypothetical protein
MVKLVGHGEKVKQNIEFDLKLKCIDSRWTARNARKYK